MNPPVLIYRELLFAPSEPFITAQAEGLQRHDAFYLALRRSIGHPPDPDRDLRWRPLPAGEPLRRHLWKRWGVAPSTNRVLRQLRPKLVHAHFGRDAAQILPAVRRLDLPLVVTFHGHDALRTDESFRRGSRSDRLYLARTTALAEQGSHFLAVSTVVRDRLLERGFPSERTEVLYLGVETDRIAAAAVGERDPGLALFVGRLDPNKGPADLLEALAVNAPDSRGRRAVFIGDGPLRVTLERKARELGVEACFLGFLTPGEVWRWMARARVVVVPSRSSSDGRREAFGLVAAEAQAAGAAVVASRCGGLSEAIAPVNADLMFPEGDVSALAERLDRVFSEPLGARGALGRDWIRANRDLRRQTSLLEDIYDRVVM